MTAARALGVLVLLSALYYLRFYLVATEPMTLVQMAAVILAGIALLTYSGQGRVSPDSAVPGLCLIAAAVLAFVISDQTSHSGSDTLNRVFPTWCLLLALAPRVLAQPGRSINAEG